MALCANGMLACQTGQKSHAAAPLPESPEACRARQKSLVDFVAALPDRAVAMPTRVVLPASTLGAVPGPGVLVEIGENEVTIDGATVADARRESRIEKLGQWAKAWDEGATKVKPNPDGKSDKSSGRILYVAASDTLDVRTIRSYLSRVPASVELRLLVRTPPSRAIAAEGEGTAEARELSRRLLEEAAFDARRSLATKGYVRFADCAAVTRAVSDVATLGKEQRWGALRAGLETALPSCDCGKLDTASLRVLVSAEQRAGAAAIGWIPLSFIRDERCEASMPLRSLKKLVNQMEQFDQEFSGGWQKDALQFENVLTSERLGVYFCNALPGETLAAKETAHATLYFRIAASDRCDAWTFEPLAQGSPLGTFRRAASSTRPPLAFHYRQAAEELRVFGPADARTRPTDERDWKCDETLRLTGVDESSIALDKGRWFFSEASCQAAQADASPSSGCFAMSAAGIEAPAPP